MATCIFRSSLFPPIATNNRNNSSQQSDESSGTGRTRAAAVFFVRLPNRTGKPSAASRLLFSALSFLLLLLTVASSSSSSSSSAEKKLPFSSEERVLLRQAFLRKFGLEKLARTMMLARGGGQQQKKTTMPNYMWTLYERHSASPEAEVIRHYFPSMLTVHQRQKQQNNSGATGSDNSWTAWTCFNLSATGRNPHKEQILRAELRLPQFEVEMDNRSSIGVFRSDQQQMGMASQQQQMVAVDRRMGSELVRTPWLDVGALFLDAGRPHPDQLCLDLAFSAPLDSINPDEPLLSVDETKRRLESMALIVYSNVQKQQNQQMTMKMSAEKQRRRRRRTKRRAQQQEGIWGNSSRQRATLTTGSSKQQGSNSAAASSTRHRHRQHARNSGHCRKAELYVDFRELNWQDWIMAPIGYEAYQCRGRCLHPMPSHLNTTNHAIVQSLIHSIDPEMAPAPSCVPVKMGALSILYRDVNDVIVVKTYADMRVEACGCH